MANPATGKGKEKEKESSSVRWADKGIEVAGLFLILAALYLAVSLVTYDAADLSRNAWPVNHPILNKGGLFGAWLGDLLYRSFGLAAYVLAALVGFWGGAIFFRYPLREMGLKAAGIGMAILSLATFASYQGLLTPRMFGLEGVAPSLGGVWGEACSRALCRYFGGFGTMMAILFFSAGALLLATDWLIYAGFLRMAVTAQSAYRWWTAPPPPGEIENRRRELEQAKVYKELERRRERFPLEGRISASEVDLSESRAVEAAVAEMDPPAGVATLPEPSRWPKPADARPDIHPENRPSSPDRTPRSGPPAPAAMVAAAGSGPSAAPRASAAAATAGLETENRGTGEPEIHGTGTPAVPDSPAPRVSVSPVPAQPLVAESPAEPARAGHRESRRPMKPYAGPPLAIFEDQKDRVHEFAEKDTAERAYVVEATLRSFNVEARVVSFNRGPVITQYDLELGAGVPFSRVASLADDLAIALKAPNVRIIAPIPGTSHVGVEVPNPYPEMVRMRDLMTMADDEIRRKPLPLLLGKNAAGQAIVKSLADMPHLLIAGTTGSGKSVCISSVIVSLVSTMSPQELKLLLIDPKMVEMSAFRDIPHLWCPVITDMKKAPSVLEWVAKEMEDRYALFARVGVRKVDSFNALGEKAILEKLAEEGESPDDVPTFLPYIVVMVDELADLMMTSKEVEKTITRLAQKSRAVGIHLVVATQRPSVNVVTGLIKANMPSRIAFKVASQIDSRTILDRKGAERLLGKGDMLFLMNGEFDPLRAQCTYLSDREIRNVVDYLKTLGAPEYHQELIELDETADIEGTDEDEMFDEAVRVILESQRGSTSLLQRKLGVGYTRAARLVDHMAKMGIVGDYNSSKARQVMMTLEQWEQRKRDRETDRAMGEA